LSFFRSRRGPLLGTFIVIVALFLIRPGAGRLRTRIAGSLSAAMGRPVDIAYVSLRLLPQPGFYLQNFVVHEDAAFGSEPMLRADEVVATLRISSLLRGRFEIARLTLTEPSLNLVQNGSGHWNLENLLQRAATTPVAPTSKRKTEGRPGFPYIEADRSRINFKLGQEKKPYSLTNSDFSLWQDSENGWGMRLKAQPMRTDFNLSDTGLIRVEGSWRRAAPLRDTPLQFNLQWERAQLGQVSKLVYGRDQGWRGAIQISVALSGTPSNLGIEGTASAEDFRRYDLANGNALRLAAQCRGRYSSVTRTFPDLSCRSSVGGGFVTLDGSIGGVLGSRDYQLALMARAVPLQSLIGFAQHAKKGLATDLSANGELDANFNLKWDGAGRGAWSGSGAARGLRLASRVAQAQLSVDTLPFRVSAAGVLNGSGIRKHKVAATVSVPALEIGPFSLAMGQPAPATVQGLFSSSGYRVHMEGDVQIQRLLQLTRILGLPVAQPAAEGIAKVSLQVAGEWSAFAGPRTWGNAQLRAARAQIRGLNEPVEIASANLVLTPDEVTVRNFSASLAGSGWHGLLVLPRQCALPGTCPVRFDLHADTVATEQLGALLNAPPRSRPWYRFAPSTLQPAVPYLRTLVASGKLSVARLDIRRLIASQVSSNVTLENGQLRFSDLTAEVLGGRHTGQWTVDFTAKPPKYAGSGVLQRVILAQLGDAMQDSWITGTADGRYRLSASGWMIPELISSADGEMEVAVTGGELPHIMLAGEAGFLVARQLTGELRLRDSTIEIAAGKLDCRSGIFAVSGTASLGRVLNIRLSREGMPGFDISGTLAQPRVTQAKSAETQAALKP
jgi:AsmA family/AsmA-like C-terminal region